MRRRLIALWVSPRCSEAAQESVDLAIEFKDKGVVGVDISGNPRSPFAPFQPLLLRARAAGLPLAVHFAEISHEEETAAMLALRPERLGHACCLSDAEERALIASRIPVEVCMTSNVRTRSVPSYEAHHLRRLLSASHPVALCTDDPGLFHTSLSDEYVAAAKAFGLSRAELLRIASGAVEFCFASESLRATLRAAFRKAEDALSTA